MGFINTYKTWKVRLETHYPTLYLFIFFIPWYKMVTLILFVTIYFLKQDVKNLEKENLELTKIKTAIVLSQVESQDHYDDIPFTFGIKIYRGGVSRMTYVNKTWVNELLADHNLDEFDIMGRPVSDFWPYETSAIDQREDHDVAQTPDKISFRKNYIDIDSAMQSTRYWKWRKIEGRDTLIFTLFKDPWKGVSTREK